MEKAKLAERTVDSKQPADAKLAEGPEVFCTPEEEARGRLHAQLLRQVIIPAEIAAILGMNHIDPHGARAYMESVLQEAGNPADPIERMLIQQMILAHHRLIQIHGQAHLVKSIDQEEILNTGAAKLTAEFRRLALAIKEYRAPVQSKAVSVVHQQNVVSGGDQKVTYLDQSSRDGEKISARSEEEGKPTSGGPNGRIFRNIEESEAGGGREAERQQTAAMAT
jgi:hypothetical protein